ncbi:hydrolase [Xenophilus sp. AP218F]|nr:HD domain-containing protein [Chromobacterium sp. ASV5]OWY40433.1 hydrolase [Xenophilus sp. AP218F]
MNTQELQHWQQQLIELLERQPACDDGAHDLSHLNRVWASARQLLVHYPQADALVVMAGCYLHDLVNLPKNHPDRHLASRQAAQLARRLLSATDFPADRLDNLAHAIEAHSFSAAIPPQTLEARIVQDADRMDALGAIGLARMFYTAGRMGSGLAHPLDPLGLARDLDDRAWSLDHIEVKLAKLPAMMQTEAGRVLAEQRVAWLRQFRDTFCQEWLAG